jgi:hypothetical protein
MAFTPGTNPDKQSRVAQNASLQGHLDGPLPLISSGGAPSGEQSFQLPVTRRPTAGSDVLSINHPFPNVLADQGTSGGGAQWNLPWVYYTPRRATADVYTIADGTELWLFGPRQFAVPTSDLSVGNWTTQIGGTSNLFAVVDETIPDDSDYIRSEQAPASSPVTLAFGTLSTPQTGPRYLRYHYGKDSSAAQMNLSVELLESGVSIQTWSHTDIPVGFLEVAQQITVSITNYGALSVRLTATQV